MTLFDFDTLDSVDSELSSALPVSDAIPAAEKQYVLLRPVNGLCNRLSALASAWLLAQDLGRELVVDWRCTPVCNCPLERLLGTSSSFRVLSQQLLNDAVALSYGLALLESFSRSVHYIPFKHTHG